jgi:hypothetical protein
VARTSEGLPYGGAVWNEELGAGTREHLPPQRTPSDYIRFIRPGGQSYRQPPPRKE